MAANDQNNNHPHKVNHVVGHTDNAGICRICLEPIKQISLTDTCFHPFCLQCLRQWSQSCDKCPFCRQVYRNILANYTSDPYFQVISITPRHPLNLEFIPLSFDDIRDLIGQIRENQRYITDLEEYISQTSEVLNDLDPNSIEYIQCLQTIANTEQLIEDNRQVIALFHINLRNQILDRLKTQQNENNAQNHNNGQNVEPEVQNPEQVVEENNNGHFDDERAHPISVDPMEDLNQISDNNNDEGVDEDHNQEE